MARWSCDGKTVGMGRECGARSQPGGAVTPRTGSTPPVPPPRGDVTAVSPRLPSGALLALTAAITAATAMVAALPAWAGAAAPGRSATARAGTASRARSDRIRDQEWWLANLDVPQAWQFSRGAGITVAVLSSGVEAAHPDLTGSVVTGPDLTGSGEAAGVPSWRIEGTSAASVIAGHGDNVDHASGIIGVAPAARILSIRVVLDATDPLNANPADVRRLPAAIAAGIRYAAGHGAQVIDLPLDPASLASDGAATGGLSAAAGGSAEERAAVSYALGKGAVLVASAGDNGEDGNEPTWPAAYPGVIAVGAVDRHFARAPFSIRQSYAALTAPGVNLTTASPPSGYRNMSTTDAASAMVAGVAALIRSRYPALTGGQVRQALLAGSVARPPSGTAPGDGGGTVDALKAVQAAVLIATPRASASAPSSAPAKAQAPGTPRPAAGHPQTGILGRAKTVLRDAAMAAGMLIVLLLASLLGIRFRRRRTEQGALPAPEPRTLLNAPSGPLAVAGGPRHTRAAAHERAAAAHMATPGVVPWRTGPGRQDWRPPPGGQDGQARAHAPGQGAPAWAATRMALPGAPAALASGPPPRVLPVPGAPLFPGPSSAGFPGRPGTSGATRSGHDGLGPVPGGPNLGSVPGSAPPGAALPGGSRRKRRNRGRDGGPSAASARISAHGLRLRVTPVSRAVSRAQVNAPGGPPWEPAPMPEEHVPHETARREPDPFALFAPSAPPAPATPAPWDVAQPGQVTESRSMTPPGHVAPPGHVGWSGHVPAQGQAAPAGASSPPVPPQPGPPLRRRGRLGPGAGVPGADAPGRTNVTGPPPASPADSVPPAGTAHPMTPASQGGPVPPASQAGPVPPAGAAQPAHPGSPAGPALPVDPAGPVLPTGRLRSGGPVPSMNPAFPGGAVPPRRPAVPGDTPPWPGGLPLARPSSFAGSSGPPEPPRPVNPAIPAPAQPGTSDAASGKPGRPAHPPGTVPGTTPPPGPPGGDSPPWRRSPYSGRHTSDTGPQPAIPGPPGESGPPGEFGHSPGWRPGDAPSGPLYIWNPAALTEPFPSAPPPSDAERPDDGTEDAGNPAP
jgi:subtilisin family serine protease